jgi:hypothetical protein
MNKLGLNHFLLTFLLNKSSIKTLKLKKNYFINHY